MTSEGDQGDQQQHVVSITTAGDLHLALHRDPQELKKKRNRLAQRKHREPPKESSHTSIEGSSISRSEKHFNEQ